MKDYAKYVEWAEGRVANSCLFAFNTNVDVVFEFSEEHAKVFSENEELAPLLECVFSGGQREIRVSRRTAEKLAQLRGGVAVVGGQAGNMANVSAALGVSTYLHVYSKSERQISLIDKNVMVQTEKCFKPARMAGCGDEESTHYVFEFKKGVFLGKKIPASNRVIASYDEANFNMLIDDNFERCVERNIGRIEKIVLGGFHLLGRKCRERVAHVEKLVERWRDMNQEIRVFLELGDFQDLDIAREVKRRLFPLVDCVGMNEVELKQVAGGDINSLRKIVKSAVIHTKEGSVLVGEKKEEAQVFASIVASYRAFYGKNPRFEELYDYSQRIKQGRFGVKGGVGSFPVKERRTVGLGDCFASAFFLTY
ncbi:MAG: ADP-dependent glucokinase/phosphofructokinase [Candidatus Micrarchaeia archaeon]